MEEILQQQETKFFRKSGEKPFLIAGPCSAESEEQVMTTARGLVSAGVDLFRSGIWKPRTRPGSFEGVGGKGLPWLQRVKKEFGLSTCIEVASAQQVEEALRHEIDVVWIGARSTANPFSVQEIADALTGVHIPVMVKNPTNPDIELWIGAIERIQGAGIKNIAAIHRGFSIYAKTQFRNEPYWAIPLELRRRMPDTPLFCDNSHICGNRHDLLHVAQFALDLNYDGLMTETHCTPDLALSDAQQQITPAQYQDIINALITKTETTQDEQFLNLLEKMRHKMDELDIEILNLLARRMQLSEEIGRHKKNNRIAIFQVSRWNEILEKAKTLGREMGLNEEFVSAFLSAVHQESIAKQTSAGITD